MSERKQIILYVIATRKYDRFVAPLLDSINKYFLKRHDVSIVLFTDGTAEYKSKRSIQYVNIPSYKYPEVTLLRYKFVTNHKELFEGADAIYYFDADMLIVSRIGEEILPDERGLVAIRHPGFWQGGWGSHGTHERSFAYVPPHRRDRYFCGGVQGGSTKDYLRMAKKLSENIEGDYKRAKEIGYTENNGILAEWNDESHYNWYLTHYPYKELDAGYCYPESRYELPFEKKIVALDKNHKEIRE